MTDRTIDQVLAGCAKYWASTGVPAETIAEMRAELQTHLDAASAEGKSVDTVVGTDLNAFAEEWAAIYRGSPPPDEVEKSSSSSSRWMWLTTGVLAFAFALIAILAPKGENVDAEQWQWIWVGAAVILGIGELLTAGFFLLPFAVGAAAAAVLAFMGVGFPLQLVTFVVVSVVFLAVLQRFARQEQSDGTEPAGGGRFHGKTAVVLEPINRLAGTGSVRMETEQWRATTDGDDEIPVGEEVVISEVRGTRLVVESDNGQV